jgi:hypothetical protein
MRAPSYEFANSMRYVWEASNAAAVWGKYLSSRTHLDVAISYTHFVVPCYIETFQVDEKILFPNSPALSAHSTTQEMPTTKGFGSRISLHKRHLA